MTQLTHTDGIAYLEDGRLVFRTNGVEGLILTADGVFDPDARYVDTSDPSAHQTIQAAVDAASAGDRIYLAPGDYEEEVVVDTANLTIVGSGNRGSTSIVGAEDETALTVTKDDVTLANIGVGGDGTGGGALVHGRRFRAYGCKFEGGAIACHHADGPVEGDRDAADGLYDGCEFAWADVGLELSQGFNGAVTQLAVRRCRFHNVPDAAITASGVGADGLFRNLEVSDCVFDDAEDGTAPTAYILLNQDNANTGLVTRCSFPTAIDSGDNLVSTALHWVANYHTGGISTAQPS